MSNKQNDHYNETVEEQKQERHWCSDKCECPKQTKEKCTHLIDCSSCKKALRSLLQFQKTDMVKEILGRIENYTCSDCGGNCFDKADVLAILFNFSKP